MGSQQSLQFSSSKKSNWRGTCGTDNSSIIRDSEEKRHRERGEKKKREEERRRGEEWRE
jgi:hypothetical protein